MTYTPATKFPPTLRAFQWARPDGTNPRLANPIDSSQTTIELTSEPMDYDGVTPLTGDFLFGIAGAGYNETCYAPAGSVSGTTITGAVRGVRLTGTDFTTGDSALAVAHGQDSAVYCNVSAIYYQLIGETLTGVIPTGANNFRVGALTAADIKRFFSNDQTDKPYDFYDESAQRPRFHMGDDGPSAGLDLEYICLKGSTAALAALPELPTGGMIAYDTTLGETVFREGGAWVQKSGGGSVPDASTTVAGKVEVATSAETIAGTDIGGTGAKLIALPGDIAKNTQSSTFVYGTSTTGSDTYVTTLTPAPASWNDLRVFYVKVDTANTGACSINPNGLGARSIKLPSGSDPQNGDIAANSVITLANDGTNCQLISQTGNTYLPTGTLDMASAGVTGSFQCSNGTGVFADVVQNLDFNLTPFTSSNTICIWLSGYLRIYSVNASTNDEAEAEAFTITGKVGGNYSSLTYNSAETLSSSTVDPFGPPAVPSPGGTSFPLLTMSITPASAGSPIGNVGVVAPVWSGSNLRIVATLSGDRGSAGSLRFVVDYRMSLSALKIA